jgi:hypothetical protein
VFTLFITAVFFSKQCQQQPNPACPVEAKRKSRFGGKPINFGADALARPHLVITQYD